MTPAALERFLLGLPGATRSIQWGEERVFKVGGKMFAAMSPQDMRPCAISFKASSESFHILTRCEGIQPAPYLARAQWVHLERLNVLKAAELKAYLARAHAIVAGGLSKKKQAMLGLSPQQADPDGAEFPA